MTVKIEERVGVQASQERLWEVLSNLEGWGDWNPLNPKVEGRLAIGSELTVEQRWPGQGVDVVKARVLDWVPLEQIHWRTDISRGWAWSVRYLEIEALGPNNCVFSAGELFGGLLGGFAAKRLRPSIRAGLKSLCEGLRAEAEKAAPAPEPKPKATAKKPAAAKAPAKPKAAAKAAAPPAKPPAKKKAPPLKPIKLKAYAPEPLGMKKKP